MSCTPSYWVLPDFAPGGSNVPVRRFRLAFTAAALCAAFAFSAVPSALAQDYAYWFARAQDKVYRTSGLPSAFGRASSASPSPVGSLKLSAAQAEYEGRQVAIRPLSGTVTDLWIEPSVLTLRSGASSPSVIPTSAISVYKVQDVYISKPSYGYSRKGWQPDPLVPMTLSNGERLGWRRGTTPDSTFRSIAAGRTQPFYVLFNVPDRTPARDIRGHAHADRAR